VQAVTRLNAEQSSKRTLHRPTRSPHSSKVDTIGEKEPSSISKRCAGVVAMACTQGKRTQHGSPALANRRISPHIIRHTLAMGMLQSGTHFEDIALWLGYESANTTHRSVEANLG
jgi:site-specific recombinase XerC